jgi:hypothetical protein
MEPSVRVVEPGLESRGGEAPPHLYRGEKLCLYYPRFNEWHGGMFLAHTIVPWTSEWLFNYELWLATGEWFGGGIHPQECRRK